MKKQLFEFFKPDRNKILVTFLYPYLIFLFYLIKNKEVVLDVLLINGAVLISDISRFFFSSLNISTLSYPPICSCIAIYRAYRNGVVREIFTDKFFFFLIFLGIIILNPWSLNFGEIFSFFLYLMIILPTIFIALVYITLKKSRTLLKNRGDIFI